ncbi:uncharacterized protein BJ171DRAFT_565805 [Polychytrium aggregatum]|uniref:uncharacterized protein n=1 Tax=Polychytrium aggregatum TaxID=110093 RepID=UPI0022FDCE93|nr:uncharacterized protein BJ171DRAFT_565805 [Polychytrium aggregatum]KAI9207479.1 hypothetical protein BJ171DRAFT_565805 [Polychytrium aggregatum]
MKFSATVVVAGLTMAASAMACGYPTKAACQQNCYNQLICNSPNVNPNFCQTCLNACNDCPNSAPPPSNAQLRAACIANCQSQGICNSSNVNPSFCQTCINACNASYP